mgnify:CR=1 FL=1
MWFFTTSFWINPAQVHTSLIAFYAGVDDNSLCVIVRQRCGVFQIALRTGHRYMMVMAESGTVDIVLPIVRFSIVIGIQCRIKFGYIVFLEFFSAAMISCCSMTKS